MYGLFRDVAPNIQEWKPWTDKACPFCSSRSIKLKFRKTAIVECRDCGAMIIKRTVTEAMRAWEKRPGT